MSAASTRATPDPGADLSAAVAVAQADLGRAVERAGLQDDPYRYPLAAISAAIGLFPGFLHAMRETTQDARQPVDPAVMERLEKAAAKAASRASAELVRAHNRRSLLVGVLAITAAMAASGGACFWWGRSEAMTQFHVADAGFAAMVHDNPTAATGWLNLAQLNDYGKVMAVCQGSAGFTDGSGRHACVVPLWLDDGSSSAPPTKTSASPAKAPAP